MRFEAGVKGAEKIRKMGDMCGAVCFFIKRLNFTMKSRGHERQRLKSLYRARYEGDIILDHTFVSWF